MPTDAEVVIVADDGSEHVFPPGFSPRRAAAVVRGVSVGALSRESVLPPGGPAPSAPPAPISGAQAIQQFSRNTLGQLLSPLGVLAAPVQSGIERTAEAVKAHPIQSGALIASAALTGGGGPALVGIGQSALAGAAGAGMGAVAQKITTPGAPPLKVGETLGTMATEGAKMGAAEAGGRALSKAAEYAGGWLMRKALNPTLRLDKEFPKTVQTLIDEGIPVSGAGREKAQALLKQAKGVANQALAQADAAVGASIPVQMTPDLLDSLHSAMLSDAIKATKGQPVSAVAEATVSPAASAFLQRARAAMDAGEPILLKPSEADVLKTQLQLESQKFYRKFDPEGRQLSTEAQAIKAHVATQLNTVLGSVADGYREANALAQKLIGADRGLWRATRPGGQIVRALLRPSLAAAVGGGAGYRQTGTPAGVVTGMIVGGAMGMPSNMSRTALALTNPAVQAGLRSLPKVAAGSIVLFEGDPYRVVAVRPNGSADLEAVR